MSVATQTDFRWLFMHELRLKFRTLVNPKRRFGGLGWAIALLVTLQGFALLGVWVSLPSISGPDAIRQSIFWILLFAMPIMFGAAMDGTVESFFKRGDLDLLLSSPVKPSRVLLVRWLAIAFNTLVTPLFLLIPVINAAIVLIAPKLVFSYLVLVSVALVMTAFGTVVASNLIRSVGPKLARRIGAIISTSSAAVPVLGPQLFRFLPNGTQANVKAATLHAIGSDGPGIVVTLLDAASGDFISILLVLTGSACFFVAICLLLTRAGMAGMAQVVSTGAPDIRRSRTRAFERHFTSGRLTAMLATYFRLMSRRPGLSAQLFGQILPIIPILVGLAGGLRLNGSGTYHVAAASLVFVLAQVAAVCAASLVEVDDAAEFVATSPIKPLELELGRVVASILPALMVASIALIAFAIFSSKTFIALLLVILPATLSLCVLNLRYPRPWKSRSLDQRAIRPFFLSVSETLLGLAWATATYALAAWL